MRIMEVDRPLLLKASRCMDSCSDCIIRLETVNLTLKT